MNGVSEYYQLLKRLNYDYNFSISKLLDKSHHPGKPLFLFSFTADTLYTDTHIDCDAKNIKQIFLFISLYNFHFQC